MMLISATWRALIDAGVEMVPIDARHVELRRGRHSARMLLHTSQRPLTPSEVTAVVDRYQEPGLLVVPVATAEVRQTAERAGWSWLVLEPGGVHGILRLGTDKIWIGDQQPTRGRSERGKPGRVPWGSLTVVRRLLEQPAATQKALAALAQVSQPRVSQTLTALADRQLVERTGAGWKVRDFDGLLRMWLDAYPGPRGISTCWYGLDPPRTQAEAVMRLLAKLADIRSGSPPKRKASTDEPFAVLSGDVAADIIAPWRSPARAVIYARTGADLTGVGLTPAGAEEATLELIVPQDPGVWPPVSSQPAAEKAAGRTGDPAKLNNSSMPIADTLQVLWDVERAAGSDKSEAAARLMETLREHSRITPRLPHHE